MDFFGEFIKLVISGIAWDVIKSGAKFTGALLNKAVGGQKLSAELSPLQLDALAMVIDDAPSYTKSEPSALEGYLSSRHVKPRIMEILQQKQINIAGDNTGVVVGGDMTGGVTIDKRSMVNMHENNTGRDVNTSSRDTITSNRDTIIYQQNNNTKKIP